MKIAIAGDSYVGLSNAILQAQYDQVVAPTSSLKRVAMLIRKQLPIEGVEIQMIDKSYRHDLFGKD